MQRILSQMRNATFDNALSNPLEMHGFVQAGLPVNVVAHIAAGLGLRVDEFAALCGMSRATFHRKNTAKAKLGRMESDMVARYALLLHHATEVFSDAEAAAKWLREPQIGLGGALPIDFAQSTQGFQEVEKLLTRIEYSVYA
jgi:putative toxin-antitoxin system antitoxin component (TIGR02293 family)